MASLDFPSSPTQGQLYSAQGKTWQWNGLAWAIQRITTPGDSAYDIAVQKGFVGDQAAWIASLKGIKGDKGDTGSTGLQGVRGLTGDRGSDGTNGSNGTNGVNGQGVPTGGVVGQVLTKNSSTPFDAAWVTPDYLSDYTVPLGGQSGQFLGKTGAADGAFAWLNLPAGDPSAPEIPQGGNQGQVLTKASAVSGDYEWEDQVAAQPLPSGGTAGQVLTKNSQFEGDVSWINQQVGVTDAPSDGTTYVRKNAAWVAETGGGGTGNANYPAFTTNAGKFLKVNDAESGVEWSEVDTTSIGTIWAPVTALGTSSTQNITLPTTVAHNYDVDVFVNGIHLNTSEYSVSGTTLTLVTNASGDSIEIRPKSVTTGSVSGVSYPSFTGNSLRVLAVNGTEDGVQWVDQATASGGSGTSDPYYRMAGFFTSSPAVNEILMIYVVDVSINIPANFLGSQAKLIGAQPTTPFVLSIRKNSTSEIGTLSIATSGSITYATTSGASKNFVAGDVLSVHAPGLSDTITNFTWLLRGNKL